jgi:membrane-associated phospholipid phosphatase
MRLLFKITAFLALFHLALVPAHSGTLRQDLRGLATYRNLGLAALGFGIAGAVHPWDDEVNGKLKGVAPVKTASDLSNLYGSSYFNIPATACLWAFGRATRRAELRAVSSDLLRSLLLAQATVGPIKMAVRRRRPDGSDRRSFPSGHAANAFAVAGVMQRRYGPYVGVPLFAVGAVVGAVRMHDNHHFLSDVVAGAVLGTIVGCSVTRTEAKRLSLLPVRAAGGWMLVAQVRE